MNPEANQFDQPQRVSRLSDAMVIYAADFPIYFIECLSERHFVIAGGGGNPKTGVHNQINVIELIPAGESCAARLVLKYMTPEHIKHAIMNGSLIKGSSLAETKLVTDGSEAVIYKLKFDPAGKFFIKDYEVLRSPKVTVGVQCVKYFGDKILTGDKNGQISLWDSSHKLERQIKAHSHEVSEIDIDMSSKQIVTISRDEVKCAVWNMSNFKLIHELKRENINPPGPAGAPPTKYIYRSCKFAYNSLCDTSKKPINSYLIVACNPPLGIKGPSKLHRWSSHDFKNSSTKLLSNDAIMAMNVSQDGKLVAIGTGSGSVSILEVGNLRGVYRIDHAHSITVTKVEFLPPKPESLILTNSKYCPLLSVSADKRIVLHRPRGRSLLTKFLTTLFMALIMCVVFFVIYNGFRRPVDDEHDEIYLEH